LVGNVLLLNTLNAIP